MEVNQEFQLRGPEGEMTDRELETSNFPGSGIPSSGNCHRDGNICHLMTACQPVSDDDDKDLGCSKTDEYTAKSSSSSRHSFKPSHRGKTLQDMTTPLKKWLYENKGNPYPTKEEKAALAQNSKMTLVQVTNWFANARRRLKNTTDKPGLTWSKRKKLRHTSDNAEGSLRESDGVSKEDTENHGLPNLHINTSPAIPGWVNNNHGWPIMPSAVANGEEAHLWVPPPSASAMYFPETANSHKFKQTILHRYLNDTMQHQRNGYQPQIDQSADERTPPTVRCCESGSTGSCDNEDMFSCSPNSIGSDGNQSTFQDGCALYVDYRQSHGMLGQERSSCQDVDISLETLEAEEIYWKEIIAAVVLTNMARAKLQGRPL